jgi:hypothetical protein
VLSLTIVDYRYQLSIACACRYRILSGVYRGKLVTSPQYLHDAVKIIIHLSCAYTKHHRQRTLRALLLPGLAAVPDVDVVHEAVVDSGVRFDQLRDGMRISVWWLDDWWPASIKYLSVKHQTATILFLGDNVCTSGIRAQHIRIGH